MPQRITTFLSALFVFASFYFNAASAQMLYVEGSDYTVLKEPLTLTQPGKKEVVEFFSYACPHCANLEPHLAKWVTEQKPDDVGFYQIPVVGGLWSFSAQAKYTANKLGLGLDFDHEYFHAIHSENKRRLLGDKETAIDFIANKGGVDKEKVEKAWNSLQVKSNLRKSAKLWEQSGLKGVPAVIVNGKYVVKLTEYNRFFTIIDYLLANTSVAETP